MIVIVRHQFILGIGFCR